MEERSSDEHDAREMHVAKKTSTVQQWNPGIKFNKSRKSEKPCKLIGQEYFGIITQNNIIFFLASMEAKNKLDTSYPF